MSHIPEEDQWGILVEYLSLCLSIIAEIRCLLLWTFTNIHGILLTIFADIQGMKADHTPVKCCKRIVFMEGRKDANPNQKVNRPQMHLLYLLYITEKMLPGGFYRQLVVSFSLPSGPCPQVINNINSSSARGIVLH